ncbi:hypothetical protein ECL_02207 [Enterobacter cloacae subsp. cloacae ATCC 13047]|uniref:Uncharacterized protein n=1 Tax=Enterobacter cloacae subsp. cloacae (strain ATCC 13047 / DSM 30054 / NBRC 13535 / NCTC 10005 / WDCM 00083 / NCDC 279-56) TaxID=716541 RepID=A0A0H3CJE6_ENTCC|nr:hypothetical protein ECL_02207 [Enterobacter cloacae subsp. cloacae ATCC 13047]
MVILHAIQHFKQEKGIYSPDERYKQVEFVKLFFRGRCIHQSIFKNHK